MKGNLNICMKKENEIVLSLAEPTEFFKILFGGAKLSELRHGYRQDFENKV